MVEAIHYTNLFASTFRIILFWGLIVRLKINNIEFECFNINIYYLLETRRDNIVFNNIYKLNSVSIIPNGFNKKPNYRMNSQSKTNLFLYYFKFLH